eukprot:362607-Chlamydomonas_euryale.AAC.17
MFGAAFAGCELGVGSWDPAGVDLFWVRTWHLADLTGRLPNACTALTGCGASCAQYKNLSRARPPAVAPPISRPVRPRPAPLTPRRHGVLLGLRHAGEPNRCASSHCCAAATTCS